MAKNDMHLIIFKILKYLYGCNKTGKDIVCAAVSILAQVLAESLKHCRGKKAGLRAGYCRVRVHHEQRLLRCVPGIGRQALQGQEHDARRQCPAAPSELPLQYCSI